MTQSVVNYFASHGIRVMLSIGGITYTNDWDTALSQNAAQLGTNAAQLAHTLNVVSRSTTRTAQILTCPPCNRSSLPIEITCTPMGKPHSLTRAELIFPLG